MIEGVVIVASILLAFGIEAWWAERSQRIEVQLELENVAEELATNREQVLFQLDLMRRMVAGGRAVLEIMQFNDGRNVASVPDTLVFLSTSSGTTLDVFSGAIDALVASGRLASVENLALRQRLAGLPGRFEDVVDNQVRGVELSDTQIRPATYDYMDNKEANQVADKFWAQRRVFGRGLEHESRVSFPNTMTLRGLIGFRNTLLAATVTKMENLLVELDESLELLGRPS